MSELEELRRVVREMRAAQREYFQTRSSEKLREAKALEKRLDQMVDPSRDELSLGL